MRRRHWAAAAVLFFLLALPAVAQTNVYCVNEPACVSAGGANVGSDGAALQAAFTAAAGHPNSGGPDSVLIGAGRYTRAGGLEYNGGEVVIRGAGEGATVITAPSTPGTVFNLQTSPGTVSDLSVEIPTATTFIAINSKLAAIKRVAIVAAPGAGAATGLKTDGGSFSNGAPPRSRTRSTRRWGYRSWRGPTNPAVRAQSPRATRAMKPQRTSLKAWKPHRSRRCRSMNTWSRRRRPSSCRCLGRLASPTATGACAPPRR